MSVANILQVFILIGAAQGTLLSIAIFKRSTTKNFNWLLALGFLMISFRLFIYPFMALSELSIWGYICQFSLLSLLLVGPAIFLFLLFKISRTKRFLYLHFLHAIPFLIYVTHMIYPYFTLPIDYSYGTLLSGSLYGLAAFVLVLFPKAKKYSAQLYSLSIPLLIIPASIFGLVGISNNYLGFQPATLPYMALTLGFYRMGFKSMSNSSAFFKRLLEFNGHSVKQPNQEKLNSFIAQVEKQRLYLDPRLTIQGLSIETGLTRHEISELLNKGLSKTFSEFVNTYRIETAKKNLTDKRFDHLSIAGIGQESGFKSKSSFNLVFKQLTGLTPSEFKKSSTTK